MPQSTLAQFPRAKSEADIEEDDDNEEEMPGRMIGLAAVLAACCISGFSGVYYERLVKTGAQPSVVIRNIQLGI